MSATETTQIEVAGSPLEVLDLAGPGDEAPVVLLHEGLGSILLWRSFPATLRELTGRRVIAFSRHGNGFSGAPPVPRTPNFFHREALEILPALLDQLDVRSPALLGHSDGASIGLIYAARHPVDRLVLMAPHVLVEQICIDEIAVTRDAFQNGDLRARMQRHHADVDTAFWSWCDVWLDPAFRSWTLEAEVAEVRAPTLLIQGSDDPYGTLEQIDRIAAASKGPVERLVLPGGHSPHLEHPDRVANAVAAFLS